MSHLTLLSPEHIVYVLGELGLKEHLICFRPAEPLFKELHIQYVPVGPCGLNQGWCWRGLTICYFCCGHIGVWLCTSFIKMTRIALVHDSEVLEPWTSLCSSYSVWCHVQENGYACTPVFRRVSAFGTEREKEGKAASKWAAFHFPQQRRKPQPWVRVFLSPGWTEPRERGKSLWSICSF